MKQGALGKVFNDGDVIIRQGEPGDCMFVIQEGQVEVVAVHEGNENRLAVLGPGEFIGEMAIFEKERRSADVRALGQVRILTVDRKNLLSRIHEDPSMAFKLIQMLSGRIRDMNKKVSALKRE